MVEKDLAGGSSTFPICRDSNANTRQFTCTIEPLSHDRAAHVTELALTVRRLGVPLVIP
jgi:hypothetical protein